MRRLKRAVRVGLRWLGAALLFILAVYALALVVYVAMILIIFFGALAAIRSL